MQHLKQAWATFAKKVRYYYLFCGLQLMKFFQKHILWIIAIVGTFVALIARYQLVAYPTQDMVGYVLNWLNQIRLQGFASFYTIDADYSPLFLFILALFSLLPPGEMTTLNGHSFYMNQMIYVKSLYFVMTVALALSIFLIVHTLTKSKQKALIAYLILLALPTIFINSTIWGNADVIYATLISYGFYFSLKGKDGLTFAFFGLSFAFKMQAVFFVPYLLLLLLSRKLKFHKIIYAFIAFFGSLVPAYLLGATLPQSLNFIGEQLSGYNKLTLGCANFWQLVNFRGTIVNEHATWFGLLMIGVTFAIIYLRQINLDDTHNRFKVFFLLVMSTVFFLPHMHERYFYLIDVMVIVYALVDKKKIALVPLMQVSSIIAYYHYLSGYYFIHPWGEDSVHIAAFINLFVFIFVFNDVLHLDHQDGFDVANREIENDLVTLKKER